jgi:hypothetical protein
MEGLVELVDTLDLGSNSHNSEYQFKSDILHFFLI